MPCRCSVFPSHLMLFSHVLSDFRYCFLLFHFIVIQTNSFQRQTTKQSYSDLASVPIPSALFPPFLLFHLGYMYAVIPQHPWGIGSRSCNTWQNRRMLKSHSWPSVPVSSASVDSANCGWSVEGQLYTNTCMFVLPFIGKKCAIHTLICLSVFT